MMLLNRNREFQNHKSQSYYPQELDIDRSLDERHSLDLTGAQFPTSPFSVARSRAAYSASGTQSPSFTNLNISQSSAVPRQQDPITLIKLPSTTPPTELDDFSISITQPPELMQSDSWMLGGQFTPKSGGRLSHHRESSLSSLGSAGPASPFTQNSSNPHVALNDSASDGFHDLQQDNNSYYQLAKMVPSQETMFTGYHHPYHGLDTRGSEMDYTSSRIMQKPKVDRGLLPAPDLSLGANTSHTASVASSIGGDSPATPSLGEPDDSKRRKPGLNVPKLDRTMTDIYSDELYSPNFTITSAAPSHGQVPVSPSNDVFSQRLHAANSQHLNAVHSPVVGVSRERSPFRQGSPLAPVPGQHFGNTMAHGRLDYHAGNRKVRGNARLDEDRVLDMREPSDLGTPKTISPKDAVLEFHDMDEEGNFPLFPSQQSSEFHAQQLSATPISQATQASFSQPTSFSASPFPLLPAQIQPIVQIPQQYPFIARQTSEQSAAPMLSVETTKPRRATPAGNVSGIHKPTGASADGGTYTCTYHGCTLRFETPALLQKHKREGHRQAQTLTCVRKGDSGMISGLQNSQAGPHRCDRINPSTGKSCNTIFSRPYDLTRHEDTIHNARKQKVRCGLCTEEKTFSRADALTRHYRVCHPDIEFSGKHRKRVGQGR